MVSCVRATGGLGGKIGEALLNFRIAQRFIESGIDLVDNGGGSIRRCDQGIPGHG